MSPNQTLARFHKIIVATVVVALILAACATPTQPPQVVETVVVEVPKEVMVKETIVVEKVVEVTPIPPSKYSEAPALKELVEAGQLPPVEERLPENPLVVLPVKSIGEYGGVWHRGWRGIKDFHAFGRIVYETPIRWPRDPEDPLQAGMAEKWEWNADGTELTLYFREGLKWSDGVPFTVDDIIFWWEDIENDPNITAAPHAEWVVNGEPMTLEKINDTTITLKFAGPNGLAETVGLAFHGNEWPLGFERFGFFAPRHYLEQFHPKYNSDATYELFESMAWEYNTERPAMTAWVITEWEDGADHMVATRNPYYWKVDVEGNQLPYIDEVYFYLVEDIAGVNLLGVAGKLDMQHRAIDLAQYTVYQENAEAGDYHMLLWPQAQASGLTFFPNQSYSDPKYRELFQDLRFRQALSLAVDRDTINEVLFLGLAIPQTISVVRDSPLYQPDIANYYGQFDPDGAKALLDEIGLPVAGGVRTFADGSAMELVIETSYTAGSLADGVELVAENWRSIGLNVTVASMSRDVFWPRACANESMISTWTTDRGLVPMIDPIYQFPFDERSWMGPSFGIWYKTGGAEGEAPNPELQELMDLYDQYRASVDPVEQLRIAKEIVRKTTMGLNVIQTAAEAPGPTVVRNNFHNVPENHTSDWIIMTPGTLDPSHWWIEQ
ncbi:MAG: ABC transporter substrate-binding protein [Chloroflexota bacterium]|nr:MAG: ABC transporter substrate-binding protein [Chloroflexota bacterium]